MNTRRVYEGHLSHTDDAHLRMLALVAQHTHDLLETVTRTEEVRTVNFVNLDALGNGKVLEIAKNRIDLTDAGDIEMGLGLKNNSQ